MSQIFSFNGFFEFENILGIFGYYLLFYYLVIWSVVCMFGALNCLTSFKIIINQYFLSLIDDTDIGSLLNRKGSNLLDN